MKEQDCLRRFLFEELGLRGEWVRLEHSWQQAKQYQGLSSGVQEKLGQAMAAASLLSATIKFEGAMIMQAEGNGPLKTLVAQATHDRKIRGLARGKTDMEAGSLLEMMGQGRMVITIDPKKGEPYQGVVALQDDKLAEVISRYFVQSEQLQTQVWLFANETHAAGLFLQELPAQESYKADWERVSLLADTVTEEEMLTLDCEQMLYRLFNEEKVRLYDAEPISFECGCSAEKIESALLTLGEQELQTLLKEQQQINVDCEFCGEKYSFDSVDVQSLLTNQSAQAKSDTRH